MPIDLHAPDRVRVVGIVQFVSADGRFGLTLDDGREAAGRATGQRLVRLGRHLGQRMVVLGMGDVSAITADGVLTPDGAFRVPDRVADIPTASENAELLELHQKRIAEGPSGCSGELTDHLLDAYMRNDH